MPQADDSNFRKRSGDTENFPARNTASIKSPEFPGTDRFLAVLSDLGTSQHITLDATVEFHLLISSK
jgi:hypothetical protein